MGSKTMQQPQRVGFRTANGDTGLQGANMPQPQMPPPQMPPANNQFEMPNVMGQPLTPMPGSFGTQPLTPMPGSFGMQPMDPQAVASPMQGSPMPMNPYARFQNGWG